MPVSATDLPDDQPHISDYTRKWPTCQRAYRFLRNPRFSSHTLLKGLDRVAQRTVTQQRPAYLVVKVDPVNFEKPYTHTLEGISRVMKDTPRYAWVIPNASGAVTLPLQPPLSISPNLPPPLPNGTPLAPKTIPYFR